MKKTLTALAALIPLALAGNAVAADKTLTISSWAGPGPHHERKCVPDDDFRDGEMFGW